MLTHPEVAGALPIKRTDSAPRVRLAWLRSHLHQLTLLYVVLAVLGVFLWHGPWWLLIPAVLLVVLVTDGIARPRSSLFYPTLSHGVRASGRVALSFDDGPDAEVTPQVLEALAAAHVHATFFVIGKALAAQPELGRRMLNAGHVLANHSWQHSRWQNFYSRRWHAQELERAERALAAVTGDPGPHLYRPPVGLKSGELARAARQQGMTLVAWSLHSRDTWAHDPERIARRVLKRIRGGDIVLMHDGHDLPGRHRHVCVPALRLILQGLQAKGLECVTVPELLDLPGPRAGFESRRSALPHSAEPLP